MSLDHLSPERHAVLRAHADRWGSANDTPPSGETSIAPPSTPPLTFEERQHRANQAVGLTDAEFSRWSKPTAEAEPAVAPKKPRPPSPRRLAQLGVTADELRELEALSEGATDAEIAAALERARGGR